MLQEAPRQLLCAPWKTRGVRLLLCPLHYWPVIIIFGQCGNGMDDRHL